MAVVPLVPSTDLDASPESEPVLELHSKAALSVEAVQTQEEIRRKADKKTLLNKVGIQI